ncbi:MAG: hypothetical protein ACRDJ4_15250 [Actinomycetota bacterium]
MMIDCDRCPMRNREHCPDCLVTALLEKPEGRLPLDPEEERAVAYLKEAGLEPVFLFTRRAS